MYLGELDIDDVLTISVNTHDPDTGSAADADSVPTYRIYEEGNDTPVATGSLAKQDDSNTVGFYSASITLDSTYTNNKNYEVRIAATITGSVNLNPITGVTLRYFRIGKDIDGLNLVKALKLMLAFHFGLTEGAGSKNITFQAIDGSKDRITMKTDSKAERIIVTLDGD